MKLLYWNQKDQEEPKVACLGFFDGLHSGHLRVISKLKEISLKTGLKTLFFTMSQSVYDFFNKTETQILDNSSKEAIIRKFELDYYLVGKVNQEFTSLSWKDFLVILKEDYNVTKVVVGSDFCFGYKKAGNVEKLQEFFGKENVTVILRQQDDNFSSSIIRKLLAEHNIKAANELLFQPFTIKGIVEHGKQLGRTINFPTTNLYLKNKALISYGVYITITIVQDKFYQSMTCYWQSDNRDVIESYLLDVDLDLYGQEISIQFIEYLRDNIKITSLEELVVLLKKDLRDTIAFFAQKE